MQSRSSESKVEKSVSKDEKSVSERKLFQINKELNDFLQRELFEKEKYLLMLVAYIKNTVKTKESKEDSTENDSISFMVRRSKRLLEQFPNLREKLHVKNTQTIQAMTVANKIDLVINLFQLRDFHEIFNRIKNAGLRYQMDLSNLGSLSHSVDKDVNPLTNINAMPMQWGMRYETVLQELANRSTDYLAACEKEEGVAECQITKNQINTLSKMAKEFKEKLNTVDENMIDNQIEKCQVSRELWQSFYKSMGFNFLTMIQAIPFDNFAKKFNSHIDKIESQLNSLKKEIAKQNYSSEVFTVAYLDINATLNTLSEELNAFRNNTSILKDPKVQSPENDRFNYFAGVINDIGTTHKAILRQLGLKYQEHTTLQIQLKETVETNAKLAAEAEALRKEQMELKAKLQAVEEQLKKLEVMQKKSGVEHKPVAEVHGTMFKSSVANLVDQFEKVSSPKAAAAQSPQKEGAEQQQMQAKVPDAKPASPIAKF